jgi:hypothetical protein
MNRGSEEAADRTDRPGVSHAGDIASAPNTNMGALPRKVPSWLLWAGAGMALAICIAILLMWGIHGPTYIFDLIAAYCL